MMRSLFAGVSGLKNHQTRMDVIGNNIANVNTVGFKGSRVTFQDMLSQNISGASSAQGNRGGTNPKQVGLGMGMASIDTNFGDGSLQSTGKNTDLAISGNGFFILGDGANKIYTRSGAFEFDTEGYYVVPGSGMHVQGWMADANGSINSTGATENIQIPKGQTMAASPTKGVGFTKNLSAEGLAAGIKTVTGVTQNDLKALGFANLADPAAVVGQSLTKNNVTYKITGFNAGTGDYTYTEEITTTNAAKNVLDAWFTGADALLGTAADIGKTVTDAGTGKKYTVTGFAAGPPQTYDYTEVATKTNPIATLTALGYADPRADVHRTMNKTENGVKVSYKITNVDPATGKYEYQKEVLEPSKMVSTLSAYDSQGVLHKITGSFTKMNDNEWQFDPGTQTDTGYQITGGPFTVTFDVNGNCTTTSGTVSFSPNQADTVTLGIDFSKLTQYSGESTATMTSRDGYGAGSLESVSLDSLGTVVGTFTNGMTKNLAQVALAVFNNPAGLTKTGTNLYSESNNSGMAQVTVANSGGAGGLTPSNLEMSNVDLSEEFSNMIVTQRGFQANSKIITVSDEMLETLSNLKR